MVNITRPDLEGLRVRLPGGTERYLVDGGMKRLIPNEVYGKLFRDERYIHDDFDLKGIDTGAPIPTTAILFSVKGDGAVFLLDGTAPNQTKRHVTTPKVMDRFNFSWEQVQKDLVLVTPIPSGSAITTEGPPN